MRDHRNGPVVCQQIDLAPFLAQSKVHHLYAASMIAAKNEDRPLQPPILWLKKKSRFFKKEKKIAPHQLSAATARQKEPHGDAAVNQRKTKGENSEGKGLGIREFVYTQDHHMSPARRRSRGWGRNSN